MLLQLLWITLRTFLFSLVVCLSINFIHLSVLHVRLSSTDCQWSGVLIGEHPFECFRFLSSPVMIGLHNVDDAKADPYYWPRNCSLAPKPTSFPYTISLTGGCITVADTDYSSSDCNTQQQFVCEVPRGDLSFLCSQRCVCCLQRLLPFYARDENLVS